jgi:hypothetical protein
MKNAPAAPGNVLDPIAGGYDPTETMTVLGGLARLGTSLAGVCVLFMARCVEIEAPNVVLLTVWRAELPIVK